MERLKVNLRSLWWQAKNYWDSRHPAQESPLPPLKNADKVAHHGGIEPRHYDGWDSSRQPVAAYSKENPDSFQVELEVAHLRPGAEKHLNPEFRLGNYTTSDLTYNSKYNRLQVRVDKAELRKSGWLDGQKLPLQLQADPAHPLQPGPQELFRWEGKTIYYAVTDRFHNPNGVKEQDAQKFHGGSWKGLAEKLDYLKDLHVDALWISCPYENQRDFYGSDGFHAYWPKDFEKPEPSFGSKEDLKVLIDKAHQKDIKVILDVVTNHTSYDHALQGQRPEWFHHNGNIAGPLQWQMENGALAGLPDLNQDHPEVQQYLDKVHKDWLKLGFDGFRMDAIRHVPEHSSRHFNETMKAENPDFFSVGEVFWQDANFVAGYQNRAVDSAFDFPLAYAIRKVFAGDPSRTPEIRRELSEELKQLNDQEAERMLECGHKSADMRQLSKLFQKDRFYDNPNKMATLLDNHDMVRFMSDTGGDLRKLELALAFLYAVRGTPCVYYGTEVGMEGFGVNNRNDMEWGKNPELKDRFAQMTAIRQNSEALQYGNQVERLATHDTYALSRVRPDEEVVCLFNNADQPRTLKVPLDQDGCYTDLFTQAKEVTQDKILTVTLPAKGYAFFRS